MLRSKKIVILAFICLFFFILIEVGFIFSDSLWNTYTTLFHKNMPAQKIEGIALIGEDAPLGHVELDKSNTVVVLVAKLIDVKDTNNGVFITLATTNHSNQLISQNFLVFSPTLKRSFYFLKQTTKDLFPATSARKVHKLDHATDIVNSLSPYKNSLVVITFRIGGQIGNTPLINQYIACNNLFYSDTLLLDKSLPCTPYVQQLNVYAK